MRKTITVLLLLCLMAVCLTGCQKKDTSAADKAGLADYLTSVESQSNALKSSLEMDALTQNEMNQKSGELRDLWNAALNRMQRMPALDTEAQSSGRRRSNHESP